MTLSVTEERLIELYRKCDDTRQKLLLASAYLGAGDPTAGGLIPPVTVPSAPPAADPVPVKSSGNKRNMEKLSATAEVPLRYEITVEEMNRLHDMIHSGKEFEALSMAFDFGFALGRRAEKKKSRTHTA